MATQTTTTDNNRTRKAMDGMMALVTARVTTTRGMRLAAREMTRGTRPSVAWVTKRRVLQWHTMLLEAYSLIKIRIEVIEMVRCHGMEWMSEGLTLLWGHFLFLHELSHCGGGALMWAPQGTWRIVSPVTRLNELISNHNHNEGT